MLSVITGSGIGAAVAVALARDGWSVVVAERRAQVVAQFGRVDLLVNTSGVSGPPRELDAVPLSEWKAVVDVNLTEALTEALTKARHHQADQVDIARQPPLPHRIAARSTSEMPPPRRPNRWAQASRGLTGACEPSRPRLKQCCGPAAGRQLRSGNTWNTPSSTSAS